MSFNYKRKFLILKNKYSNIKGYKAKGHLKLEMKGAHINFNLNIENAEADRVYSLTLISDNIIELGKIYTDSYGRAKSELLLKTEDFLHGEIEHGAIIIHEDEDILLGEYMDKDDGRIEEYIQGQKALKPELEDQIEHELDPEFEDRIDYEFEPELEAQINYEVESDFESYMEAEIEQEVEMDFEPSIEEIELVETPEQELEFTAEPMDDAPEFLVEEEPEMPEIVVEPDLDLDLKDEEELHVEKTFYEDITDHTTNYVLSILRHFQYIEPFKEELRDHNWWIIDYNDEVEEGFLPYFDYILETHATKLLRKYKHYLFGLFNQGEEVKYYVYAVPGAFTLEEHPNEGLFGFNTWYEGVEEVGYWLLYIDPTTGRIVEPRDKEEPS